MCTQQLTGLLRPKPARNGLCLMLTNKLDSITYLQHSNAKGKMGKQRLNEQTTDLVKSNSFHLYPLATSEQQLSARKNCIKAIDESCRKLNRKNKYFRVHISVVVDVPMLGSSSSALVVYEMENNSYITEWATAIQPSSKNWSGKGQNMHQAFRSTRLQAL